MAPSPVRVYTSTPENRPTRFSSQHSPYQPQQVNPNYVRQNYPQQPVPFQNFNPSQFYNNPNNNIVPINIQTPFNPPMIPPPNQQPLPPPQQYNSNYQTPAPNNRSNAPVNRSLFPVSTPPNKSFIPVTNQPQIPNFSNNRNESIYEIE